MGPQGFQPSRLKLARCLRGLRQTELAKNLDVSAAALSQFESGDSAPGSETVERMSVILGCTPSYFYRRVSAVGSIEPFFRRRRNSPSRDLAKAFAYAVTLAEITEMIDQFVEFPVNAFGEPIHADDRSPSNQIEEAAATARSRWAVPSGPIANMVRLAESCGAVITAVGAFDNRIDAFSARAAVRPVIVLCSDAGSAARRRFDTAHEIGHLVLHDSPVAANAVQEKQAHRFASAFLMPPDEIEPWLPRKSNQLALLEEASSVWGVSMQAVLYRAMTLGTLSEDSYRRTLRRMSAAGWRVNEPVELGPAEKPLAISRAVAALSEAGTSLTQVAERLGLAPSRVARMVSIPEDREHIGTGELVNLRSIA